MSDNMLQSNEQVIKAELKDLLNNLPDQEAVALTNAFRYECTKQREGYCSGHYT